MFWFCIKGNQVYYTWITYTTVLLVSIQLLFSYYVEYVKIRAFSDPYFPVCGRNRIRISPYLDRISPILSRYPYLDWIGEILSRYGKTRIQFCPYTRKHGLEKACILAYFTPCLAKHFQSQRRPTRKYKFCQQENYSCGNIWIVSAKIKDAKINCPKIRSTWTFMGLSYVCCNCLLPRLWRHNF